MCKIISLKTEYSVNPIGIETQTPRFSWEYAQCDNLIQISYRIIVASSVALIEHGTGDKWDSGIIFSEKSINVSYKGKLFRSSELCYVKVFAKINLVAIAIRVVTMYIIGIYIHKSW